MILSHGYEEVDRGVFNSDNHGHECLFVEHKYRYNKEALLKKQDKAMQRVIPERKCKGFYYTVIKRT